MDGVAGSVDSADVLYVDLSGDGREEAIVPVMAEGTAGVIGYYVFGLQEDRLVRLLARRGAEISVTVSGGRLIETVAVHAAGDPRCCPSHLQRTTFRWTGSALAPESSETIPNPSR